MNWLPQTPIIIIIIIKKREKKKSKILSVSRMFCSPFSPAPVTIKNTTGFTQDLANCTECTSNQPKPIHGRTSSRQPASERVKSEQISDSHGTLVIESTNDIFSFSVQWLKAMIDPQMEGGIKYHHGDVVSGCKGEPVNCCRTHNSLHHCVSSLWKHIYGKMSSLKAAGQGIQPHCISLYAERDSLGKVITAAAICFLLKPHHLKQASSHQPVHIAHTTSSPITTHEVIHKHQVMSSNMLTLHKNT